VRIIASALFLHGYGGAQPLTQGSDGLQSGLYWGHLPVRGQPLRHEHAQCTIVPPNGRSVVEGPNLGYGGV
jgi:hypothetical protein